MLVAGLLALVAGCSGIPGSSAAYDVAQVGDEAVPAAPLEPQAGQQPDQIVRGFVAATSRTDLDTAAGSPFGAARQYLAPDAQEAWQPAAKQVIVLAEGYRTDVDPADPATVVVNGTQVGLLDPERVVPFPGADAGQPDHPARAGGRPVADLRAARPSCMLTSSEFSTAFRQRILYFLDPTGTVVVPDMRYIVIGQSPANRASRLLALLIRGPGPQLAGAARTQFTADSALRSNPSIDADGVLRVDLTGVDASTQEAQRALAAQVVWTLSTTSPRIAITVDGQALEPGQQIYTINTVSSFDPDRVAGTGEVASDPYFVNESGGITGLADGQPLPGELGGGESPVLTAAMSSASGVMAAVTQSAEGRQVMRLAQPRQSDRVEPVLEAGMLSQPTFSRAGDQAWVVQNGTSRPEVYRVSASGQPARERVATPGIAAYGAVTALALSPDGVRAAVVAGERLWVGVIAPAPPDGGLDPDVPAGAGVDPRPRPPPDAGGSPAEPTPDGPGRGDHRAAVGDAHRTGRDPAGPGQGRRDRLVELAPTGGRGDHLAEQLPDRVGGLAGRLRGAQRHHPRHVRRRRIGGGGHGSADPGRLLGPGVATAGLAHGRSVAEPAAGSAVPDRHLAVLPRADAGSGDHRDRRHHREPRGQTEVAASLDQDDVPPRPAHPPDPLARPDDAKARPRVQSQARRVLREQAGLQRPDACRLGGRDVRGEQASAHAAARGGGVDIHGVLDDARSRRPGRGAAAGDPPDDRAGRGSAATSRCAARWSRSKSGHDGVAVSNVAMPPSIPAA